MIPSKGIDPELVHTLRDVQTKFRQFGNNLPDGFGRKIQEPVDDMLASCHKY